MKLTSGNHWDARNFLRYGAASLKGAMESGDLKKLGQECAAILKRLVAILD